MNTRKRKSRIVQIALSIFIFYVIVLSCGPTQKEQPISTKEYIQSESLARIHCASCHQYVPPEMLDRPTWPRVLRAMEQEMHKTGYMIDHDDWIKIQQFYRLYAPASFFSAQSSPKPGSQTLYTMGNSVTLPDFEMDATMVNFNSIDKSIYVGTSHQKLYKLNEKQEIEVKPINNVPIQLRSEGNNVYQLCIGSLKPSNDPSGQLLRQNDGQSILLIDSLIRPIDLTTFDFNNDGKLEYLIAQFGSTVGTVATGRLSLFTHVNGSLQEQIIDNLPGATQSEVIDLNNDGFMDIIALFSQGNEGINAYINQGNLIFQKIELLRFSPVWGTNSFDLADIDGDNDIDIITTHGDNDDYSQIYKPYHGIRIYTNNGSNKYSESFFYPINGASKVSCADLDHDGDHDFVVLAMYPNLFSQSWETLTLFTQTGEGKFEPSYFEEAPSNNWIVMEVADIDSDGDMDIITAPNQSIGHSIPQNIKQQWISNPKHINIWLNKTY